MADSRRFTILAGISLLLVFIIFSGCAPLKTSTKPSEKLEPAVASRIRPRNLSTTTLKMFWFLQNSRWITKGLLFIMPMTLQPVSWY